MPSPEPQREEPMRYRRSMTVGGTRAPVDDGLAASGFSYELFTRVAGPLTRPRGDQPYHVQYRGIHRTKREWVVTRLIASVLVVLDVRFIYWLIFQSRYPHPGVWLLPSTIHAISTDAYILLLVGMALGSIIMQLLLLMNVLTVSRACLVAWDPIPVEPDTRLRVAFLTTIVPDKEPVEMAERTLKAAKAIVYGGTLDVWLLDEGDSDDVKAMCRRLGVRYFTRKGRGHLELDTGTFASKTKHGNHNRWLWEYAGDYDVVMFVDTDHVPLPIMAERLLGYFRDPDVAFVVGPQFYGNQDNRITRWAESRPVPLPQRHPAGRQSPQVRDAGRHQRGRPDQRHQERLRRLHHRGHGHQPEHSRHQERGHRSALAVGLHPGPGRGGRGAELVDGVLRPADPLVGGHVRRHPPPSPAGRLQAPARRHAALLPDADLLPVGRHRLDLGITISACYLGFGITSLRTNAGWWLTYYVDVAVMQFLLYRFMRRHNVSPHEPAGSSGLSGMLVSALTAPIYARSLIKVMLRRKLSFNVTAKGSSTSPDRLWTFRYSLMWAIVPIVLMTIAVIRAPALPHDDGLDRHHPAGMPGAHRDLAL